MAKERGGGGGGGEKCRCPPGLTRQVQSDMLSNLVAHPAGPSPELKVKTLGAEREQQRSGSNDRAPDDSARIKAQMLRPYVAAADTPMSPSSVKRTGYWMGTAGTRLHGQEAVG